LIDRPNRKLEIPSGPDPALNRPIDLTVPQHGVSPQVKYALESMRHRIGEATEAAKQQIAQAGETAGRQVAVDPHPGRITIESVRVDYVRPLIERQKPKGVVGTILEALDFPGRKLTETAIGVADVAKQTWQKGSLVEKVVGIPVLAAGAFVLGAAGGVLSLASPKAWYETAVALSRPRETYAELKETVSENPLRALPMVGALVAPVKLPRLARVGIVERARLVPERVRIAVKGEAGVLEIRQRYPARTWKAEEALHHARLHGVERRLEHKPPLPALEHQVALEKALEAAKPALKEIEARTYVRLEPAEPPLRTSIRLALKDLEASLAKNYEALVEASGRVEVLGRRIGRMPEPAKLDVKARGWARALREDYGWGGLERRIYARDIEQAGFMRAKETVTFERLRVRGERFKYEAQILDPELALERVPMKPAAVRRVEEMLRARDIHVVRPLHGPPGLPGLVYATRKAERAVQRPEPKPVPASLALERLAENLKPSVQPPEPLQRTRRPDYPPPAAPAAIPRVKLRVPDVVVEAQGIPVAPRIGKPKPAETVPIPQGLAETPKPSVQPPEPLQRTRRPDYPPPAAPATIPVRPAGRKPPELEPLPGEAVIVPPKPAGWQKMKGTPVEPDIDAIGIGRTGRLPALTPRTHPRLRPPGGLNETRVSVVLPIPALGTRAAQRQKQEEQDITPPEPAPTTIKPKPWDVPEPAPEPIPPRPRTTRTKTRERLPEQVLREALGLETGKSKLKRWEWELPEWMPGVRRLLSF